MGAAESALLESRALPPSPPQQGATGGGFWGGSEVCSRRQGSNSRLSHPILGLSLALLTAHAACSVLSGAAVRVAERADGGGPTARVPGIAAAAAAAVAAVVAARPCRESGLVGAARVRV